MHAQIYFQDKFLEMELQAKGMSILIFQDNAIFLYGDQTPPAFLLILVTPLF